METRIPNQTNECPIFDCPVRIDDRGEYWFSVDKLEEYLCSFGSKSDEFGESSMSWFHNWNDKDNHHLLIARDPESLDRLIHLYQRYNPGSIPVSYDDPEDFPNYIYAIMAPASWNKKVIQINPMKHIMVFP